MYPLQQLLHPQEVAPRRILAQCPNHYRNIAGTAMFLQKNDFDKGVFADPEPFSEKTCDQH